MLKSVVSGRGSSAYGLYIHIWDERQITDVEKSEAEHKVQIAVKIGETSKDVYACRVQGLAWFRSGLTPRAADATRR